jgi:hypothetical protein
LLLQSASEAAATGVVAGTEVVDADTVAVGCYCCIGSSLKVDEISFHLGASEIDAS